MTRAIRSHWPEYLMEAALLGIFMILATAFTVALESPVSRLHLALPSSTERNAIMGVLVGGTAVGLILSPWGKRSGAHFNPSTTLTFLRLGKIEPWDAFFYVLAQFAGALAGTLLVWAVLGRPVADPPVHFIATMPGPAGAAAAFAAELAIAFGLMLVVLSVSNHPRLHEYTPWFVGVLVGAYIFFEAPLSGMSLNPARSFAPALLGHVWTGLWIYFTAPPLGMLLGAQAYLSVRGARDVYCAKLHHANDKSCIFLCGYGDLAQATAN